MNATIEEKKAEAIARMKLWGIAPLIVNAFERKGKVAESVPPICGCYFNDDKEQKERIRKFETERNALVYHIIHHRSIFGKNDKYEIEEYLYVSDYPEEWAYDREGISEGNQLVYCNNLTAPDLSELGYIGIKRTPAGGLDRVY